eukprot:RCo025056
MAVTPQKLKLALRPARKLMLEPATFFEGCTRVLEILEKIPVDGEAAAAYIRKSVFSTVHCILQTWLNALPSIEEPRKSAVRRELCRFVAALDALPAAALFSESQRKVLGELRQLCEGLSIPDLASTQDRSGSSGLGSGCSSAQPSVSSDGVPVVPESVMARMRRAETVLRHRTARFLIVLERCSDTHNTEAVFRSAEAFGVQHVWLVSPQQRPCSGSSGCTVSTKVTRGTHLWLNIREFASTSACLAALRDEGWVVWATEMS